MIKREYERWCSLAKDNAISEELKAIADNENAIEDAFYRQLEFGTGGLRGVIGAGTNRMNIYTVARASLGLGNYILKSGGKSVAIGYDTRINSRLFAECAACTIASLGIKVNMYSAPLPTPMLSYAVRELSCEAGIMITASHNPSKYNGYKVYGSDGCQITDLAAEKILEEINKCDYFDEVCNISFEKALADGKIAYISDSVFSSYIDTVSKVSVLYSDAADKSVKIVYTPLNGTGYIPVLKILEKNGYSGIKVVKEQAEPDGRFPTCPYPNPEIPEALALGLECAREIGAELLLATDPDCDRVGVAVRSGEEYRILSGNEVGLLLFDYIASQKKKHGKMPHAPICVKTIVTSELADAIAKSYGIELVNVLTGFKYIGEVIGRLEACGECERFVFGFEESCGYLGGSYVRDKDGVFASLLISEMAAYYKKQGISLAEKLTEVYKTYGYAKNSLYSYEFEGADGNEKMRCIMLSLRQGVNAFSDKSVILLTDYAEGVDDLPKSNVLKFTLEGGVTLIVRPSGTEPKIKIYISVIAEDEKTAASVTDSIKKAFEKIILQ